MPIITDEKRGLMSLLIQANLAEDMGLMRRVAACATNCGVTEAPPTTWAVRHLWSLAATPGWVDAYQQAVLDGDPAPGENPDVIKDQMIMDAVHALVLSLTPEPEPEEEPDEME